MTNILFAYAFLFFWITGVFIGVLYNFKINIDTIKFKILSLIYICSFIYFFAYKLPSEIKGYNEFNYLNSNEIKAVQIDDIELDKSKIIALFDIIKNGKFKLINHPNVLSRNKVIFYCKKKNYVFNILKTSNQGVLIERLDEENKMIVTEQISSIYLLILDSK